jgi:DNA-binding MarR family transcriptional regulator
VTIVTTTRKATVASKHELMQEIGDEIRAYQRACDVIDEVTTERAGVNRTDGRCLDILEEQGPMTAGQLATLTGLTTGAITAVIDRLEHAGLARRVADEHDRRKVVVVLTEKTHAICRAIYQPLAHRGFELMTAYTVTELEVILDFLRQSRVLTEEHADRHRAQPAGARN